MADLNTGGRWCPACLAEYRPGFVECSDCGVSLVDERPLLPDQAGDAADHDQVEYDLEEWSTAQRAGLELLLVGQGVPHAWESCHLVVPRARDVEVDELVDTIEAGPPPHDSPQFGS